MMSSTSKTAQDRARNKKRHIGQHPSADPVNEYITELSDNDILLGRGFPVRSREANRRFRELVWKYKPEYEATGKHAVKDRIARRILGTVFAKGGRFVRSIESEKDRRAWKVPKSVADAWVIVSEDVARGKCKQALRDSVNPSPAIKAGEQSPGKVQRRQKSTDGESQLKRIQQKPLTSAGQAKAPADYSLPTEQNIRETKSRIAPRIARRDQHYPPMLDEDELSFRLKHPSHRKRYLLRLRRQLQMNNDHSKESISFAIEPAAAGATGIPRNDGQSVVASALSKDMDLPNDDQSMSNVSCSPSSSDGGNADDIDCKPMALAKVQS